MAMILTATDVCVWTITKDVPGAPAFDYRTFTHTMSTLRNLTGYVATLKNPRGHFGVVPAPVRNPALFLRTV